MNLKQLLFISIFSVSTACYAGGYQLQEYSVTNAGRAFAGAGIVGDDYSAIAFNPAGMTLKKTGGQFGGMAMDIHSNINGQLDPAAAGDKGKLRNFKIIPHGFGQYALSENWRLGLGLYVPFGLGTYYNKSWFGKTHAVNSEIETIDINPSLAWKVFDWLSIGGGYIFERMEARLTNTIGTNGYSDMNADGWGHGWNAGIMIEPAKTTRFGIAYRSPVVQRIKGKHHLMYPGLGLKEGISSTKLVDPEHVQFSVYQELGKWGLSAMARWTRWSRFHLLSIDSTALGQISPLATPSQVNENWRNTWTISGGVDYKYCKNLTFRTGLAYDQGAVKDAEHRTARVPDNNRWIASLGVSYMKNNWQVDLSYFHMFWKKAAVNSRASTTGASYIKGRYETQINSVGLGVQYHF